MPFLSESDYRLIDRAAEVWGIDERSAFRNAMRSYIAVGESDAAKMLLGKLKRKAGTEAHVASIQAQLRRQKAQRAAAARWDKVKKKNGGSK